MIGIFEIAVFYLLNPDEMKISNVIVCHSSSVTFIDIKNNYPVF